MKNITIALTLILVVIFLIPIFLGLTRRHRKLSSLAIFLRILIFLGIFFLPRLISIMSSSGGDVARVIGKKILLGSKLVRTEFGNFFNSGPFDPALREIWAVVVLVVAILVIIFLGRRKQR